jgi:hypothetical protein
LLYRNEGDLLSLPKSIRKSLSDVFKEGTDGRQSLVAGLNHVTAVLFEGVEKADTASASRSSSPSRVIFFPAPRSRLEKA